jgi:hypothetical protein
MEAGSRETEGQGGGMSTNPACCGNRSCGGNLTGSWNITGFCEVTAIPMGLTALCPTVQVDTSGLIVTGTATFLPNTMAYLVESGASGTLVATFPTLCLKKTGFACDSLSQWLVGDGSSCTSTSSGCDCAIPLRTCCGVEQEGIWATTGSILTLTPAGGGGNFCVAGRNLTAELTVPMGILGDLGAQLILAEQ